MTDSRLIGLDPKGASRNETSTIRTDYIDCAKCGKVMREDRFLSHMQKKHPS